MALDVCLHMSDVTEVCSCIVENYILFYVNVIYDMCSAVTVVANVVVMH